MAGLTLHHQDQVPTSPDRSTGPEFVWRVTFLRITLLIKEGTATFVTLEPFNYVRQLCFHMVDLRQDAYLHLGCQERPLRRREFQSNPCDSAQVADCDTVVTNMLKNKKRRDMSRTQDALLRQPETLPVALIVSERIKRANCPRKRRARSSRRMRSRDESQGTWAHFARRFITNKTRLIPRASDVCFPSRTSTKVFCCIDQGPPKMHSYSLASIRHDEVDSLEDPTSYDGALDVDSSHQPEAALHEIMEKEKVYRHDRRSSRPRVALNATGALQCLQVHSATQTSPEASSIAIQSLIHDTELQIAADDIPFNQLYTRPESPPFDDSFAATRFHLGHLSHHHHTRTEISVQYETSPSTKPAKFTPHACPLPAFSLIWHHRLSHAVCKQLGHHCQSRHTRFRCQFSPPSFAIQSTLAESFDHRHRPSNELTSGRWDAAGSAHALRNSCQPKCNHLIDKAKLVQDHSSKRRPIHDSRSTCRGAASSRQSSLNRLTLHSTPAAKFLKDQFDYECLSLQLSQLLSPTTVPPAGPINPHRQTHHRQKTSRPLAIAVHPLPPTTRSATRSHARPLFSHSQMSALLFLTQLLSLLPTFHEFTSYCYPHLCLNDLNSGSALVSNSHKFAHDSRYGHCQDSFLSLMVSQKYFPAQYVCRHLATPVPDYWRRRHAYSARLLEATVQARYRSYLPSRVSLENQHIVDCHCPPGCPRTILPETATTYQNTPSLDRSHVPGNPSVQYYRTWEQALGSRLAHATAAVRPFLPCTEQPRRHIPDLAIVSSAIGAERSIPLTSRTRVSRTPITIREVRHRLGVKLVEVRIYTFVDDYDKTSQRDCGRTVHDDIF
ncbi:unnamed protein product [Fusarium fujikuroi]|nr:unnamed protein product [Fusarium fujikuroi]